MLFNPHSKVWLGTLRQILINSSGPRQDVWHTRSRAAIPWNTRVATCLGAEVPLFDKVPKSRVWEMQALRALRALHVQRWRWVQGSTSGLGQSEH